MNDRIVMPLWTAGLFIVVMNTTMFNVSIPGIIHDLGITADMGSWIISGYSIGYALSTVIYSRLSDTVSIRRLLTIGLTVLGLSSVIGIFAHDFTLLLTARILQSAGAGSMAGLGLVLASRYIPAERRGSAVALISAGSAMAFGLGPIIGGLITEYIGWNGLFAVTCLVLALLPVLLRLLPREQPQGGSFDAAGAALTVINAAALLLTVTRLSVIWLLISLLSLAAHAWHIRRSPRPFINAELLRRKGYGKLLVIGFCLLMLNLGNLFLMPLALANVFHRSPLVIGLMIAPGAILSTLLSRFFGRWIDRYGSVRLLYIGLSVLGAVLAVYAFEMAQSPAVIVGGYLFFSSGYSLTISSLNTETSLTLPKIWIGSGMGFMQLIQFFGGSVSVALCGLLLEYQRELPLSEAYRHVYGGLAAICAVSILIMLAYRRPANE